MSATGGTSRLARVQSLIRCNRASESPPPESATAPGQGAPASRSSSSIVVKRDERPALALALAGRFARARRLLDEALRGARIFLLERDKGGAAFLLLARGKQGLAELYQAFRRAGACRILLDDFGKCTRRASIVFLNIVDATDPVDCL